MALTGIEIFKKLPKTNCKDCGFPTCLAFAMSLAAGKVELDRCPHVSETAKAELSASSVPPIRQFSIGTGETAVTVGGETVEFRHEKTFVNKPPIALLITTDMTDEEIRGRAAAVKEMVYDRAGATLKLIPGELLDETGL
ncbi:MAG TPA: (Fe-S)-binding protein, partial [bacterium]|nr:(Fe-S)-binding protein [bacterium]